MYRLNKVSKSIFISLATAGLLSFGITAQAASQTGNQSTDVQSQSSGEQSDANVAQQGSGGKIIFVQKSSQVLASSIMGMSIQNGTGKDAAQIGTINDLIMNKQHQLVGIVVGVGGFLGIGQKNVGIPWTEVRNINPEKGVAVVDVTKKELSQAPAFTTKHEKKQQEKQQQQLQKQREQAAQQQEKQQKALDLMKQKTPQKPSENE